MKARRARGFTLIELMTVVAVAGIVMTAALPSLSGVLETRRIDGVATQMASDLQFARSEAVLRNQSVRISFQANTAGATACYIVHTGSAGQCVCSASGPTRCEGEAQAIKTVTVDADQHISLQANVATMVFDPLHGTATPTATLRITSAQGRAVNQVVNIMGRVRSCSPQAAVSGYRAC